MFIIFKVYIGCLYGSIDVWLGWLFEVECVSLSGGYFISAMPSKRFSIVELQGKGLVKTARVERGSVEGILLAVVRRWGSAFWVFEGRLLKQCVYDLNLGCFE